ncbi:hypothetical protein EK21DRAFT_79818 [Setomelanomma holmii]|uniref:Uncharacterized protein n=1 Tax=Setomelanomma holmii TaxID=210430 RepID=A0A9P4GXT7_9PLEO|nr:hypothetical protein EK21DRAFT_79818 [Setomelanomma holmii]
MLGSFYEKAWDLDRSAHEDSHSFTTFRSEDKLEHTKHKRRRSSLVAKMHLPNGDHGVRFGNIVSIPLESKVHSDSTSTSPNSGSNPRETTREIPPVSKPNKVLVEVRQDQALGEVLDTVLTAWTLLIQRYQRDTFHHFTWGIKDAGDRSIQCIDTLELDLPSHAATKSLTANINSLRSKEIVTEDPITIFLNDGTKEEASTCQTIKQRVINTI